MKCTKQNVIAQVQSSVSSIFSKEDVLFLINSIEETSSNKVTAQDIERAIDKTISWLENNEREFLDLDSAELEMDYNNTVSCVGVRINEDSIREALENNFGDFGQEEVDADEQELVEIKRIEEDNN
jgi:hypothetical protein